MLEPIKVKPKRVPYLRLAVEASEARQEAARLRGKRATRQAALLDFLAQQSEAVPLAEARQRVNCDKAVADALVSKGLANIEPIEVKREPISYEGITPSYPLTLTTAQKSAFNSIQSSLMPVAKGHPSTTIRPKSG